MSAQVLPHRLSDRVYQQLQELIFNGSLSPGCLLKEEALAREFGVSSTPVRAALAQLARDGLVTARPHNPAVVRVLDAAEIEHVFDVREALEVLAIETACSKITENDEKELRELQRIGEEADSVGDVESYRNYNAKWHATILRIANNACLSRVSSAVSHEVRLSIRTTFGIIGIPRDNLKHHAMMLDALHRRDREKAGQLMRIHIQTAKEQLLKTL